MAASYRHWAIPVLVALGFATFGGAAEASSRGGGSSYGRSYVRRSPGYVPRTPNNTPRVPSFARRTPNYAPRTPSHSPRTPSYSPKDWRVPGYVTPSPGYTPHARAPLHPGGRS
jgi:hypothetical protein